MNLKQSILSSSENEQLWGPFSLRTRLNQCYNEVFVYHWMAYHWMLLYGHKHDSNWIYTL